jgi:dTDP-L-rhamnose 4-epimerase
VRVLLTGAAGFIGRVVEPLLISAGAEVVAYDRARCAGDDVTDLDRVRSATAGCEAVIHLAAKVGLGVDLRDIDDYVRSNDLGTAIVLRAAAESGVRRVVYASSMVVYGEGGYRCPVHGPVRPPARSVSELERGRFDPRCPACDAALESTLVTESAPLDPRNVYAATKVHGEHLLAAWARETGRTAVALRFHNVYGPGMPEHTPYAGVAALFRSSLLAGSPPQVFEDGRQRRDFVQVSDVAAAVVLATTASLGPGCTALNIGSGEVTTIGEVAGLLATAMGGPAPEVTGRFRLGDVRHITADSSAARTVLGWTPRYRVAEGLRIGL